MPVIARPAPRHPASRHPAPTTNATTPNANEADANAANANAERLARLLYRLARRDSVRAIEGVAASLVNRAERLAHPDGDGRRRFAGRSQALASLLAGRAPAPAAADPDADDDPAFAMCLRVARRALAGALTDPTGGATLCHAIEHDPRWARERAPVACIGRFLFYRDAA